MDLETRVDRMDEELKLVKNEIKQVLLEIQEQVLGSQNPFSTVVMGAASRQPTQPAIANATPPQVQAETPPPPQAQTPPPPQPQVQQPMPAQQPMAQIQPQPQAAPFVQAAPAYQGPPPTVAPPPSYPDSSADTGRREADLGRREAEMGRREADLATRGPAASKDRIEEPPVDQVDRQAKSDGESARMEKSEQEPSRQTTNNGRDNFYARRAQRPDREKKYESEEPQLDDGDMLDEETREPDGPSDREPAKQPVLDLVMIAGLTQWTERVLRRAGKPYVESLLEVSVLTGRLSPAMKETLLAFVSLMGCSTTGEPITAKETVALMAQLDSILGTGTPSDARLLPLLLQDELEALPLIRP